MSILRHDEINFKKINYKKPDKQGMIYYSAMDYDNNPFYLQTPRLRLTNSGVDVIESKNNNLELTPLNNDFSFYDSLLNLDELNVKRTFENNKEWFGKEIPLEVIDNMYKRNNKPVKKDSNPQLGFKIPMIKDRVQCQVYDQKRNTQDLKTIKEGSECVCILHVKGLKFLKQHYYLDLYVSQIKIFLEGDLKYNILDNYSFNDVEEEENELRELERDLMLDEDYLDSLRNKEAEEKQKAEEKLKAEEKQKLLSELEINKQAFDEYGLKIKELENAIQSFN